MKRQLPKNVKSPKKAKLNYEPLIKFDPKLFETIPQEILVEIFLLVPFETLTKSLVFVSKKFHQIIYDPQNDMFRPTFILFPFQHKIPNYPCIKSLKMENNLIIGEKHNSDLLKLKNVENLQIPLQEDYETLSIIEKYFTNLKYLYFGQLLNDQVWKVLKKLPNLEVLKVVDLEEMEFDNCNLKLTELEVLVDYSYATYGYDENGPLNFNKTVKSILKSCPKLEKIQFHAESFYIDLDCLFKIVMDYSKQLHLVTLSVLEDSIVEIGTNQVQKVDFNCSFLNVRCNKSMAIVLNYLFPNCEITILDSSIKGKRITKELLEKRKILKDTSDLEELAKLLSKTVDEDDEDEEDDEDDDEELDAEDGNEEDEDIEQEE